MNAPAFSRLPANDADRFNYFLACAGLYGTCEYLITMGDSVLALKLLRAALPPVAAAQEKYLKAEARAGAAP